MASVTVHYPRCQFAQINRHGQNPTSYVFAHLTYEARKPGVKEQITERAFNEAGVRDTVMTLKVGINTVVAQC